MSKNSKYAGWYYFQLKEKFDNTLFDIYRKIELMSLDVSKYIIGSGIDENGIYIRLLNSIPNDIKTIIESELKYDEVFFEYTEMPKIL